MEDQHRHRKQATADEKAEAVLKLLKGEDAAKVAEEFGVAADRLTRWERTFVGGGRAALAQSAQAAQFHRHKRKLTGGVMAAIAAAVLGLFLAGFVLYQIVSQSRVIPPAG